MRLIDADALDYALGASDEDIYFHHMLEDAPAVDAVPVVHAHWIKYEPDMHGTEPLACSACDYLFARLYPRNYCPFCGAKMDEEGE